MKGYRAKCRHHRYAAFSAAVAMLFVAGAAAQTLYTATSRGYVGSPDVVGRLYVIEPDTAAAKIVGPIHIKGLRSIGVTGLAVHPQTGVLYGITAGPSPELRPSLVTIDTRTAEAKLIGPLGAAGSDINFDSSGTLYVWLADKNRLGTVDPATGVATPLGPSGIAGTGGGLAINARGEAFVAVTTATGTLDSIDLHTGAGTRGPALTGAPYLSAINSLTFSPTGVLFGVNSNLGAPANTVLVTIDTASGAVNALGSLPTDADGLAFSPDAAAMASGLSTPQKLGLIA